MKDLENPFVIYQYSGPKYFCDREQEISMLLEAFKNNRFIVLSSMRRLGKSGLIHHFHHLLNKKRDTISIYCDVQNTRNDQEFVTKLITSTIHAIEKTQKKILARVTNYFTSLRPVLSFDPITATPKIELAIKDKSQVQSSLNILMDMLGEMNKKIQIAIDEFQQITQYEDGTIIDATLRGYLQKIPNVHFLFSGSQRHLLTGLFSDTQKPFFNAVDHLHLHSLDPQIYTEFISKHFQLNKQDISINQIHEILNWTRGHTYHTQYFCNRLYAKKNYKIQNPDIESIKKEILYSYEQSYLQLRSVLSKNQWKVLVGIAKEKAISSVTNKEFLSKNRIALSSADQALKVLLVKELAYEIRSLGGNKLIVYDPFFARWLEQSF